jgi:hypothetical protein
VLARCGGLAVLSEAGGVRLAAQAELHIGLCLGASALEIFPAGCACP